MQVPLQISFHGVDTSTSVEERIREKVAKLEHYFNRIVSCRVVIERLHRSHSNLKTTDQPFHVSVVLDVPGDELVAGRDPKGRDIQKGYENVGLAIQAAFGAAQRQLKDYARRRRERRLRHAP